VISTAEECADEQHEGKAGDVSHSRSLLFRALERPGQFFNDTGPGALAGVRGYNAWLQMDFLQLVTIIVDDYDEAIKFFVEILGFELTEDSPSLTNDGRPKRWVVVRPPEAETGILLAQADGDRQSAAVGDQFAGRVGMFLRVADFEVVYQRLVDANVEIVRPPRDEAYGRIAVFRDIAGNRWDLLAAE
jgi:catechol 2,3-dioxygenase-like lactoylglutathione lyase family enzyme